MRALIVGFFLLLNSVSFAQENLEGPISFSGRKAQKVQALIRRFTGTYQNYNGAFLTLSPHLSTNFYLSILSPEDPTEVYGSGFGLDFSLENKIEKIKTGSMGGVTRETSYRLSSYGVTKVEASINFFRSSKEVVTTDYQIGEDWILRRTYSRVYYKRKMKFGGMWILDTTSYNGAHNTIEERRETYTKMSTDVLDLYALAEERRLGGAEITYRLTKSIRADKLSEAIQNGDYEIVVTSRPKEEPQRLYSEQGGVLHIEQGGYRQRGGGDLLEETDGGVISMSEYKKLQCKGFL